MLRGPLSSNLFACVSPPSLCPEFANVAKPGQKERRFLSEPPRYHRNVRGTWPPESPAKSYLKASFVRCVTLNFNFVAERRRVDDSEVRRNTASCQSLRRYLVHITTHTVFLFQKNNSCHTFPDLPVKPPRKDAFLRTPSYAAGLPAMKMLTNAAERTSPGTVQTGHQHLRNTRYNTARTPLTVG